MFVKGIWVDQSNHVCWFHGTYTPLGLLWCKSSGSRESWVLSQWLRLLILAHGPRFVLPAFSFPWKGLIDHSLISGSSETLSHGLLTGHLTVSAGVVTSCCTGPLYLWVFFTWRLSPAGVWTVFSCLLDWLRSQLIETASVQSSTLLCHLIMGS